MLQNSVQSKETAKQYTYYVDKYLEFYGIDDYDSLTKIHTEKSQIMVEDYVMHLKNNVGPNSVPTYVYPLQAFYEANDIILNWKKIKKLFPALQKKSGRQAYTTDDIDKMLSHTSILRNKVLIHFLASSGVRIGALQELKLKHLTKIKNCYAILVYEDSLEEYHTFLTPEATEILDRYLAKRQSDGERFNQDTPVFRHRYILGSGPTRPMTKKAMQSVVERGLKKAGLRNKADRKNNRYPVQLDHGFRKRLITTLKSIKEIPVAYAERIAGHKVYTDEIGNKIQLDDSYLRPELEKLFSFFEFAIPELTINQQDRIKLDKEKLEKETNQVNEQRLENEKLLKRIEALECGLEARESFYAKSIIQSKDGLGKLLNQLLPILFENMHDEDYKQKFWKELLASQKENRPMNPIAYDPDWEEEKKRRRQFAQNYLEQIQNSPDPQKSELKGLRRPKVNMNRLMEDLILQ